MGLRRGFGFKKMVKEQELIQNQWFLSHPKLSVKKFLSKSISQKNSRFH